MWEDFERTLLNSFILVGMKLRADLLLGIVGIVSYGAYLLKMRQERCTIDDSLKYTFRWMCEKFNITTMLNSIRSYSIQLFDKTTAPFKRDILLSDSNCFESIKCILKKGF